jgi:hypothetical protein
MSTEIPKGKPVEGDMTAALDSRFLNAIVLQGALEKTGKQILPVKIDRVEFHDVLKYENGTRDKDVYLMYFEKSNKPLKLAKTNIKRIIVMHGSIGAGWHGKPIGLCLEDDRRPDLGGQKGPCVRVSLINPETGKPGAKLGNHDPFNK